MLGEIRIRVDDGAGGVASYGEEVEVRVEACPAESGEAGLSGTEEVTLTADAEVLLSDAKSILGAGEDAEAFAPVPMIGHQNAVAGFCSAADPPPQLVELGEPEAFGVLNHHHGSVRHVDPHLHHRRCDEQIELAGREGAHHTLLLL